VFDIYHLQNRNKKLKLLFILFLTINIVSYAQNTPMPVLKGNRLGYINQKGEIIIDFKFETDLLKHDFEYQGKVFKTFEIPNQAYFNNGYATVTQRDYFLFIPLSKSNIIINENAETELNGGNFDLGKFSCGLIPIGIKDKIVDSYIDYYTYCDITGKFAIDDEYDYAGTFYDDIAVVMKDRKYYFIDKFGNSINNETYNQVGIFSDGFAAVMIDDNWGYINFKGSLAIKPEYEQAFSFSNGLAKVRLKDNYGYISKYGDIVVKPIYAKANDFNDEIASVQNDNGKWGFINKTGKFVIQPNFISAGNFSEGLAPVDKDGKFGYINKSGEFVISPKYDFAKEFLNGLALVWESGKIHYINKSGEIVWTFDL
jgi:hypothetical protein